MARSICSTGGLALDPDGDLDGPAEGTFEVVMQPKSLLCFFSVCSLLACGGGGATGGTGGGHATAGGTATAGGSGTAGGTSGSAGGTAGGDAGGTGTAGGSAGGSTGGGSAGGASTSDGGVDLGCAGANLPGTAPAMLTISGTVVAPGQSSNTPLAGATVQALSAGGATLGTATSASTGTFTLNLATGGAPLDAHLEVTASGRAKTAWYPARPLVASVSGFEINSFDSSTLGLLGLVAGISVSNQRSQIFLTVRDCADAAVAGATVSSSPMAQVTRYISNGVPSSSATATDADGTAFLGNVPAGNVTLGGAYHGTMMRQRVVSSQAGIVIQAAVQP